MIMLPMTSTKRPASGDPSTINFDNVAAASIETYWPRSWAAATASPSPFKRSSRLSLCGIVPKTMPASPALKPVPMNSLTEFMRNASVSQNWTKCSASLISFQDAVVIGLALNFPAVYTFWSTITFLFWFDKVNNMKIGFYSAME